MQSNGELNKEIKRSKKYNKKASSSKKKVADASDGTYKLSKEKCPVCGEFMHEAPGLAIYCDNPACPVEDDSYYYETGQKKGKVGDGKRGQEQRLKDMAVEVKALMKHPDLCRHPSFAIVCLGKGGPYQLFCRDCRTPMPFSFYSEKEWKLKK